MTKDLEFVYAEIKHHLDNVLADETILTIIQMLKDYPEIKEKAEDYPKMNEEALRWRKMYSVLWDENKRVKEIVSHPNIVKVIEEWIIALTLVINEQEPTNLQIQNIEKRKQLKELLATKEGNCQHE